jgi:hypothetical protein
MNKLLNVIIALILSIASFAQAPEKMSYQAVIRDAGNALLSNQSVGMQISILESSSSGIAVYVETQTASTNANGLVSIEIGAGTVVSGSFNLIDWSTGMYFVKTETDPNGGANYTITATTQLLSVPYALHAKTAETSNNDLVDDADPDPVNEIQTLSISNDTIFLTNGGFVKVPASPDTVIISMDSITSYVVLLDQFGVNAPNQTIVNNSAGLTVSWSRISPGKYVGTISPPLNLSKTVFFVTAPNNSHTGFTAELTSSTSIQINALCGVNAWCDGFNGVPLEIRLYY